MFECADEGKLFVLTSKGYDRTPEDIKPERKIGQPMKGYEKRVPISWLEKGYVEQVQEAGE